MGLQQAQQYAQSLQQQALSALDYFGDSGKDLLEIAQFVLSRRN